MDEFKKQSQRNPAATANLISQLLFWWLNPLFKHGYRRSLEVKDMFDTLPEDSAEILSNNLEREWKKELRKIKNGKKPSLAKAIIRTFGCRYILIGLVVLCEETIKIISPLLLAQLISCFSPGSTKTQTDALMYATGVSVCALLLILFHHPYFFYVQRIGMRVRIAACSLIYRKALKLSHSAMGQTTTGQIVNLLSNDVNRFDVSTIFLHYLWIGPLQIIAVLVLLWREIGPSCLAGFAVLLIMMPFQGWMGRLFSKLRAKTAVQTDQRVRLMNEIISGMRVIKMYTWEKSFSDLIRRVRRSEISVLFKTSRLWAMNMGIMHSATGVILLLTFISYIVSGNTLTPKTAFFTLTIYNSIRFTTTIAMFQAFKLSSEGLVSASRIQEIAKIRTTGKANAGTTAVAFLSPTLLGYAMFIPYVVTGHVLTPTIVFKCFLLLITLRMSVIFHCKEAIRFLSEVLVTVRRLQKFLLLDELDKSAVGKDTNLRPKASDCEVSARDITGSWDTNLDTPTLKDINFEVKPGQLMAVIGPVGSGKSSLLMALLGELPVKNGILKVKGKVAYSSQQPWVFSASVRQNILFGMDYEKKKYDEVIEICALKKDIQILPDGDLTMVGERGVTLSGGQRARVNLARAVYSDADIYLLDDPLSAVDSAVGRHLFNKCILGHLSSKPCILVTHQLQYLAAADDILILKQGEMAGHGTFDELLAGGVDFASLLKRDEEENPKKRPLSSMGSSTNLMKKVNSVVSLSNISASMHSVASIGSELPAEAVAKQQEEEKSVGNVGWSVYKSYFKAGCSFCGFIMLVVVNLMAQGMFVASDLWLSLWASSEESKHAARVALVAFPNSTSNKTYTVEDDDVLSFDTRTNILIYTALVVGVLIFGLIRAFSFFHVCVTASKNLHNRMFAAIIRAPIYFFDTNPVGRILNRFSRDIGFMDDLLPWTFFDFCQSGLLALGIIIVAGVINPWVFIPTAPLVLVFLYLRKYFLATSRDIKRLEGVTRSPVFSHLSASLQGLCTIRAFNAETIFTREFDSHQDLHTEGWFLFLTSSRWFAIRIELLCACFVMSVAFCSVFAAERLNAGLVGLSLTYSLTLMGMFQWCVRQSAEVENQMTSVERVLSYSNIPPEPPLETDTKPDPWWPKHGIITMEGAYFKYSEDAPYVLKNVYLCIRAQEKVGIVGRTGAGKSSLISLLFRTSEPQGVIKIDGVDICEIGLHDLRSKISIIPQDPVMFTGTLRENLDPFTEHTDVDLWKALEQVQLSSAIDDLPGGLETEIAESGTNLSVGQRQLVCLARAILRNNKILIIDEATANVDPRTDMLIQKTIRSRFQHCTVLTIAHRLNTVMDSDRILVLDEGRVVEFDEPHLLLQNPNGHLYKFVQQVGKSEANTLHDVAMDIYQKSHPEDKIWIPDAQRSYLQRFIPTDAEELLLESTV